jgi:hypothetical protein
MLLVVMTQGVLIEALELKYILDKYEQKGDYSLW